MSGMPNGTHFRRFGEFRSHSRVLMLSCGLAWWNSFTTLWSAQSWKNKHPLCRNAGSRVEWIFDVCSPQKVKESRGFWKRGTFVFVVNDFANRMSTFSSNQGTFPRDCICWGSFSLISPSYTFPACFSLPLSLPMFRYLSFVRQALSLFLCCFMSLAVPSPPDLHSRFHLFFCFSLRGQESVRQLECFTSNQLWKPRRRFLRIYSPVSWLQF